MWDIIFNRYILFLMVFARMSGMLLFNPILGRRNVPTMVKIGLAFLSSMAITTALPNETIHFIGLLDFVLICFKEIFVGLAVSLIITTYMSVVLMSGELIDTQLGLSMAKIYDPQSNVSMPLSGTIFNLMFVTGFFLSNSHLTLFKILFLSFQILPAGPNFAGFSFAQSLVLFFAQLLIMAIKLALPIVAIELISEFGMGVLMRTVPQLNVFIVGLQVKLLVGLIVFILIVPSAAGILDSTINSMFEKIGYTLNQIAG
ncbi:MAG: flagellar biosynthetic protein FliR [Clostridiales bacterium]|nr:flagellar biosynthetic protein FliR [Clostridiales bacterium]